MPFSQPKFPLETGFFGHFRSKNYTLLRVNSLNKTNIATSLRIDSFQPRHCLATNIARKMGWNSEFS